MVTNRILLFGGTGQVGKALQKLALPDNWHMGVFTRPECDFMHPESIGKTIQDFGPDLVINAAAMTGIEACEKDQDKAQEINFHAVANIAAQCDTVAAPLIHLSTNYVFDGRDGNTPYCPDAAMNPLNVYGQTKMLGEEAVRHGMYWHVILRTSLIFSAEGENILTRTLRQIDTQNEVSAVLDQIASPTSAAAVAEAVVVVANAIMDGKGNGFGTFHVCGEPAVTRFDFLQAIMEAYAPLTDRRPKLTPVSAAEIPDRVPRPLYSALNGDKARNVYGIAPRPWREDLVKAIEDYAKERVHADR